MKKAGDKRGRERFCHVWRGHKRERERDLKLAANALGESLPEIPQRSFFLHFPMSLSPLFTILLTFFVVFFMDGFICPT